MIPAGRHFKCCCFDEIGHRKIELEQIFHVCRQMHDPPCKCLLQSHLVLLLLGFGPFIRWKKNTWAMETEKGE